MKLFKKLAAAVLAAALALTMVGCGGNSYATQNELLKITIDQIGETVTHTKKADEMAAALLAAADTAAEQMENKGVDAKELLQNPAVIKAAKIDLEKTPCMFNPIDVDSQIKSSGVLGEFLKMQWMMEVTSPRQFERIGTFDPGDNKVEIGAATHKIGDKSYILILVTYTPTTPSIT
ncbi:hypothetical protein NE589_01810 [Faecalibacterium prausnitzii]|jgi:lipoprotein|uniref:hypothetical protein n=1 Tax=Faecalibacterium prausnitzii TaxID=853 RepID=UPI0021099C3D|nr:hypothetical protein [Faecalibacterium prausnitzii]MCQ4885827.1 hypothetical protein [Faecalibacterium prausnitzii]